LKKARHSTKKPHRKRIAALWILAALFAAGLAWTNIAVLYQPGQDTAGVRDEQGTEAECILVLGARVDGSAPSVILENRLLTGVELYRQGAAPKLLLTGDGGQRRYDEVSVMQQYALDAGVPAEDIVLDREGFNTYTSLTRAKDLYGIKSMIIVTQSYHMPRALYDARALGIEAKGAMAQGQAEEQWYRDLREIAARAKDYILCLFSAGN